VVEVFIQLKLQQTNSVYIQIFLEGELHGVKPVRAGFPLLGEKGGRGIIYCKIRGLFLEQIIGGRQKRGEDSPSPQLPTQTQQFIYSNR
jgi:hypothetical protein